MGVIGFSDRPFVAGSLHGRRSFRVINGKLHGVTYPYHFEPGENTAVCAAYFTGVIGHRMAGLNCTCGYYAYFKGPSNSFHSSGNVEAIIEGYGTVSVGEMGFRAAKAKLAALILPDTGVSQHSERWDTLCDFMNSTRDTASSAIIAAGLWVSFISAMIAGFSSRGWLTWLLVALTVMLLVVCATVFCATVHGYRRENKMLHNPYKCSDKNNEKSVDYEEVRMNYPGVPVYSSMKDALKDFPVSTPKELIDASA